MRARLPVVAVLTAAALTGCGSSTKVVTDTASSTSSASSAPASTATATASTTTSSTSSTGTSAAAGGSASRCVGSMLAVSVLGQQGAAGHGEIGFSVRNTSAHSCHTFGYPGILFLSHSGAPLPTASTRTTHDFFGSAPAAGIVLAPGSAASFRVGVTHGISSSAGCVTAGALQVIAPDDTATLRVPIPGGAYECGSATVSPLQPGNAAYR